ncbi:hypothetical protein ACX27_26810 [Nostoc piscinale CENA21]|uniref:Ribbon-helix-helix protein CopG domain-containing protein n=1 Tax=Nostoc piscinale CENA21 TaxID=224013 RepID=A0A0M4SVB7_9NOSO|nr:ribbon-helix-helix protein, CopG family [Nostoc piscinale]ALF55640.1 hypothetical protein ACX27_26810 [Nostoc piscinale CENA21]
MKNNKSVYVPFRAEKQLIDDLDLVRASLGMNRSAAIREAIDMYLRFMRAVDIYEIPKLPQTTTTEEN